MLKIKEDKLGIHATVCAKRKGKPAVIRASEGIKLWIHRIRLIRLSTLCDKQICIN